MSHVSSLMLVVLYHVFSGVVTKFEGWELILSYLSYIYVRIFVIAESPISIFRPANQVRSLLFEFFVNFFDFLIFDF